MCNLKKISMAIAFSLSLTAINTEKASASDGVGPIYLYGDENDRVYTLAVTDDNDTRDPSTSLTMSNERHYLSAEELTQLRALGFDIKVVTGNPILKSSIESANTGNLGGISTFSEALPSTCINGACEMSSVPTNFTIIQYNGIVYGNFFVSGSRPSGKTTQWSSFKVTFSNFANAGTHLFHGVLLDTNQLINNKALVSNAVIFGNVSSRDDSCGYPPSTVPFYNVEIESSWSESNKLYPETCSKGLSDNVPYLIGLQANTSGWVAYTHHTSTNAIIFDSPAIYTAADRVPGNPANLNGGGIVYGLIKNEKYLSQITITFQDQGNGWF